MNRILIIGGNGYIGTRLHHYLYTNRDKLVIDQFVSDYGVDIIDTCWFGKVIEDTIVEDYKTMSKEFYSEYDTIILLAGHSKIGRAHV